MTALTRPFLPLSPSPLRSYLKYAFLCKRCFESSQCTSNSFALIAQCHFNSRVALDQFVKRSFFCLCWEGQILASFIPDCEKCIILFCNSYHRSTFVCASTWPRDLLHHHSICGLENEFQVTMPHSWIFLKQSNSRIHYIRSFLKVNFLMIFDDNGTSKFWPDRLIICHLYVNPDSWTKLNIFVIINWKAAKVCAIIL